MELITLYARKEPTTCPYGGAGRFDVVLYTDKACTDIKARYSWYKTRKPRKGQKQITLNCWPWALQWVN